jgi:hypothetical protein
LHGRLSKWSSGIARTARRFEMRNRFFAGVLAAALLCVGLMTTSADARWGRRGGWYSGGYYPAYSYAYPAYSYYTPSYSYYPGYSYYTPSYNYSAPAYSSYYYGTAPYFGANYPSSSYYTPGWTSSYYYPSYGYTAMPRGY